MARSNDIKNYFPHDSGARNDDKIIRLRMRHKATGYGVYFMILERLRESSDYMSVKDYNMIAFDLREDASLIKSVIEDFGLFVFTEDGKYFYSESLRRRMERKDSVTSRRSEGGKKGMARRWESAENQPSDNSVITHLSKNDNKKESKETKRNNPPTEDKEKQQEQEGVSGVEELPSGSDGATAVIDPKLKQAISRVSRGKTGATIAADFGIELPEVEAVAREIAAEWTELGEWNRNNPATHLMRTIRCRLRDRSSPSLPSCSPARNKTEARIAAEREREKAERDAALAIDSRAALAQYMASRGLDTQTSLAHQLKK